MPPNSNELFFGVDQNLVRDRGVREGQDPPEEHDHFARSFRDEVSSISEIRAREVLGIPDLVVDRALPFVPEVPLDAPPPHLGRGFHILAALTRFRLAEHRPVARVAPVQRLPGPRPVFGRVSPLLEALRNAARGHGRGRGGH